MSATATRYECSARVTARCDSGNGTPKRAACRACGSRLIVRRGVWGVFEWTGTGRYPESEALLTCVHERLAEAYAERHAAEAVSPGGLVVRWVHRAAVSA